MREKTRVEAYYKEENGKKFFYIHVGSERHGKISHLIWVSEKFIQYDKEKNTYFVEFPILGAQIVLTEKNNKVIKTGKNTIWDVFIACGYRGGSNIEFTDGVVNSIPYYIYRSPLGSLGISKGAIIEINKDVVVRWSRSGRLYGGPEKGAFKLKMDGTVENIVDDEEVKNLLLEEDI